MIIVSVRMKVLPQKRAELTQALLGIAENARKEKGCVSYDLYQDLEDENGFCVLEAWLSQEDLDNHWCSDSFSALLGAKHLLVEQSAIEINAVAYTAGKEAVDKVRKSVRRMVLETQ